MTKALLITMGDPTGVGPEIIKFSLESSQAPHIQQHLLANWFEVPKFDDVPYESWCK